MAFPKEDPPAGQAGGLPGNLSFDGDTQDIAPKASVSHAKIELLHDEIYHNVSALQATLHVAIAAYFSCDTVCLIYGLRHARAYWRQISADAAELVAVEAERCSAFRQAEDGR